MDAPIEIEIALAEFEKAAERLEYVEALLHRLTAQRVEHDIDASAGTDCAHRIGEAEITRIQHVIRASKPQEGALDLRSGGGDDDGAAVLGVLDRREADATGPGVDQDQFAVSQLRERAKSVDHRDEGDGNGCRRRETRVVRDANNGMRRRRNPRAQRRRRKPGYPVAYREIRHVVPHGADDPRTFEAESRACKTVDQRLLRQQPHRPHHVAEIEPRGMNLDHDLAGPDGPRYGQLPAQSV